MKTEIIIVGQGIAGSILGYSLIRRGRDVRIIDDGNNTASAVAAGLFNPITGKRMVKTWKADEIFPLLEKFYRSLEVISGENFFHPGPVYRPFASIQELNRWTSYGAAESKKMFAATISAIPVNPELITNPLGGIFIDIAGYVNVPKLLAALKRFFVEKNVLIPGRFDENQIRIEKGKIEYGEITSERLIFCTGLAAAKSRYFSWLPFKPVKGDILTVDLGINLDFILSKGIFIIPETGTVFKAGSTYNRDDPWSGPGQQSKDYLVDKIKQILNVEVKILDHVSGIRPATDDRRPFIGTHPGHKLIGIFNGFGSKGVSLIPYFSEKYIQHLETGMPVDPEADIVRYFI
jgi:glycine oxidase